MKTEKVRLDLCSRECGYCIDLAAAMAVPGVDEQTDTESGFLCNKGEPMRCYPGFGLCLRKPNPLAERGLALSSTYMATAVEISVDGQPIDPTDEN